MFSFDKCTVFCRVFVLLVVICIAVYFIYANEKDLRSAKHQKKSEGFENLAVVPQEYRTAIMAIYNELLERDPEEFEVQRARQLMQSPTDTVTLSEKLKASEEYGLRIAIADRNIPASGVTFKDTLENTKKSIEEVEKIKNSADSKDSGGKKKTPEEALAGMDLGERMNTYRAILQVYERNLDRLPNMKELNYYTYRLLTDKEFNVARLEQILQASKEYEILNKNQKNEVNAGLQGNITDAQLTLEVRTVYQSVFSSMPTKEFEDFMKYKLVDYQLDIHRLRNMLLLLRAVDHGDNVDVKFDGKTVVLGKDAAGHKRKNNGDSEDEVEEENTKTTKSTSKKTVKEETITITKTELDQQFKVSTAEEGDVGLTRKVINKRPGNVYNIINPSQSELEGILETIENNEGCAQSCKASKNPRKCVSPYNASPYRDELYETIKREAAESDVLTRHDIRERICSAVDDRDRNMLAEYEQNRNMDKLKSSCVRNTYYLNKDTDLAYKDKLAEAQMLAANLKNSDPEKVLPANFNHTFGAQPLGTGLVDARNTQVGSIMPRFVYKEYVV